MSGSVELVVNGRFLTRPPTGVDRVGEELIAALQSMENTNVKAIVPANKRVLECYKKVPSIGYGSFKGHLWEQFQLPRAVDGETLLSPCNIGPLGVKNQIVIIHDAQVYITPKAYSIAFVWWYRLLLPLLAKRAKKIVTVSNYSKSTLVKHRVAPADKIAVIPNGGDHVLRVESDNSILARRGLAKGGYWLAVGSQSSHKNISLLYSVMQKRPDTDSPLVLAGGGDSNVYSSSGVLQHANVILAGRVSNEELRALYENAKALLFPSLFEGFGLPPLEAMYLGCPVVASTASAIPEVCGEAVLYADPLDEAEWLSAMNIISEDAVTRDHLVQAGFNQAKKFTWSRAANALRHLMCE